MYSGSPTCVKTITAKKVPETECASYTAKKNDTKKKHCPYASLCKKSVERTSQKTRTFYVLARAIAPVRRRWSLISWHGMFHNNDCLAGAPNSEIGDHPHPTRGEQPDEIVENDVGGGFMANMPVTIGIDVELETLQLHDVLIRNVIHRHRGKIRKARPGQNRGK